MTTLKARMDQLFAMRKESVHDTGQASTVGSDEVGHSGPEWGQIRLAFLGWVWCSPDRWIQLTRTAPYPGHLTSVLTAHR